MIYLIDTNDGKLIHAKIYQKFIDSIISNDTSDFREFISEIIGCKVVDLTMYDPNSLVGIKSLFKRVVEEIDIKIAEDKLDGR